MITTDQSDILKRIYTSIEKIRPYLQSDGGDVIIEEVTEDLIVRVKLIGACGDCPFNVQTLKAGIEETLRKDIPEIREVISH